MSEATHLYAIALGSNRRHIRHGKPPSVVMAAIAALDARFELFDASPILANPATGGAGREFANAVALIEATLCPLEMLAELKRMERSFGRRPGRRWGARVLDLDIVVWSGPPFRSRALTIPHPRTAQRRFVLIPLAVVAPRWRVWEGRTAPQLLRMLGRKSR